ncbi:STAS domain-containing protein [Pontibacter anaerobius]|uniref:STAS domain-containing protein n=1 Tax=Pontibacter anaerobius TaxID=2993940 RepID=A0ABT3RG85_9BACT|nr:STAS domain-containing protein [Pontibacter anaerobius]MCX2740780.1 STAS domain-containing protein [Pontibacter anaerobius]
MGDVAVISLNGECSHVVVQELGKRCQEEIQRKARHILLDCKHITVLNSSLLSCLLSRTSEAEKAGINLVLYQVSAAHANQINVAGLNSLLHIKKNFQDAYLHCKNISA